MYLLWPHMEEAWRDTLIHKSIGYALSWNSELYGLPWPEDEVSEKAWRGVLHVQGLGRRGTFKSTFQALEAGLSDFNEKFTFEVDPAFPYELKRDDGTFFEYTPTNRYVRTPFGLLFVVDFPSKGSGEYFTVCPDRTRYWDAPSYDAATYAATDVPAEMLPFMVYERSPGPVIVNSDEEFEGAPCLLEVTLYPSTLIQDVPVTYLRDEAVGWRVSAVDTTGNVLTTLYPHGWVDGDKVRFVTTTGATLPAPLMVEQTYYVLDATSDTLKVETTLGGGAVDVTTAGSGSFYVETEVDPIDPPLGGFLLEDENEPGYDDAGGPYPLYLYDGVMFPAVTEVLEGQLPAGVHLSIGMNPIL